MLYRQSTVILLLSHTPDPYYYFLYVAAFASFVFFSFFFCCSPVSLLQHILIYTTQQKKKNLRIMQNLFYMFFLFLLFFFFFFFICCCLFPLSYVVHISYNNSFFFCVHTSLFFIYFVVFLLYYFRCPSHSLALTLSRIYFIFYYFFNKIAARKYNKRMNPQYQYNKAVKKNNIKNPWVSEVEWVRKSTYRFFQKYFLLLKCLSVCNSVSACVIVWVYLLILNWFSKLSLLSLNSQFSTFSIERIVQIQNKM